jgi:uncharacterized membrane protein
MQVPLRHVFDASVETQLADVLDLLAATVTVSVLVVSATGHSGLPRIVLTTAFSFFAPGRAIVSNWPELASWSQTAMSMILSVAVLTVIATFALWAHAWNVPAIFQTEAGLTLAGLAVGIGRRHFHRGAEDEQLGSPSQGGAQ